MKGKEVKSLSQSYPSPTQCSHTKRHALYPVGVCVCDHHVLEGKTWTPLHKPLALQWVFSDLHQLFIWWKFKEKKGAGSWRRGVRIWIAAWSTPTLALSCLHGWCLNVLKFSHGIQQRLCWYHCITTWEVRIGLPVLLLQCTVYQSPLETGRKKEPIDGTRKQYKSMEAVAHIEKVDNIVYIESLCVSQDLFSTNAVNLTNTCLLHLRKIMLGKYFYKKGFLWLCSSCGRHLAGLIASARLHRCSKREMSAIGQLHSQERFIMIMQ